MRGAPPPPDVDVEPTPWPELVGTIQQSSVTGQFFIHCRKLKDYFHEAATVTRDDLLVGLRIGDCVSFQISLPRGQRGAAPPLVGSVTVAPAAVGPQTVASAARPRHSRRA